MRIYRHISCQIIFFDLKICSKLYGSKFSRQKKAMAIFMYLSADLFQENVTHATASAALRLKLISRNLPLRRITVGLQAPTFFSLEMLTRL